MIELNKIYNEDCLETMKRMPDNFVDLVLTDPPYGVKEMTYRKNKSRGRLSLTKDYGEYDWDDCIPDQKVFDEMLRVSNHQIIFGGNYFVEFLRNSRCWIVWDKKTMGSDFADAELAWTSFSSSVRIFVFKWMGMLQEDMKNKEVRYHPTQKPVELFRQILAKYSSETKTIYDPFLGSGTTAIACEKLDRQWIGSEINPDYCDIANKRIKAERDQYKLVL